MSVNPNLLQVPAAANLRFDLSIERCVTEHPFLADGLGVDANACAAMRSDIGDISAAEVGRSGGDQRPAPAPRLATAPSPAMTRDELADIVTRSMSERMFCKPGGVLLSGLATVKQGRHYGLGLGPGGDSTVLTARLIDMLAPVDGTSGYTHECWNKAHASGLDAAVSPSGLVQAGDLITDPAEGLIRRARRTSSQRYVLDQMTGRVRPPVSVFEPRLPENRPNAQHHDRYLSVNILSSLILAGLPRDWRGNTKEFYSAQVAAAVCHALSLTATREPDMGHADPNDDNPHHGAINGLVELFYTDRDAYDAAITQLAKAVEVFPECLSPK